MTRQSTRLGLTPREHRISVLPPTIGSIVLLAMTVFNGAVLWPQSTAQTTLLVIFGIAGIAYLAALDLLVVPSSHFRPGFTWINAILTSSGLLILSYAVPETLETYVGVLLILSVIASSVIGDRGPSYMITATTLLGGIIIRGRIATSLQYWTLQISIALMAIIIIETIHQLKRTSRSHIRRLEAVTQFSRHISSTLDTRQVMALLSAAFQNAVEADTYFVGIREGDELRLELVYDDGEYFDYQRVKLEGSLSAWVLENQRSLFLPDLRRELPLPGVRLVLIGKHRTSLSWLGVPMRGQSVDGIISIGAYHPNAFDRGDLELLTALAQHAAQALDNTFEHEQVELRSQTDSLTGVYNHGSFLRLLQEHLDNASLEGRSVGLIMLDVDNFKRYNDTYGHLVGDEVLTALTGELKKHVKRSDAVGRWGGEEFVISVPGTTAPQTRQIATRIQHAVSALVVGAPDGTRIPAPTVSQGIALFPEEAKSLGGLIHLADQRLYSAKERGRNQIEPIPEPASDSNPIG
jgi:diguanylate cyclase (GGDEF)-like protein